MAKLTRAEMEEVIRGGGSVLMNDHAGVGQIYTTIASLPSEATLALGDEKRERIVADSLDAQIAALAAQKEQLDRARDERNASKKASAKDDEARAGDANETAVAAEGDVPGSDSDGESGALASSGDDVAAQERARQNAVVRPEDAEDHDAATDVESETAAREADTSGAAAKASAKSGAKRSGAK